MYQYWCGNCSAIHSIKEVPALHLHRSGFRYVPQVKIAMNVGYCKIRNSASAQ